MSYTMYTPLNVWLDPASIPDVVAHIQEYLTEYPLINQSDIEQIVVDYITAHPELVGGVDSVNGKTGEVVLTASDINTSNNTTIQAVLTALSGQISEIVQTITGLDTRVTANATGITNEATARANADTALGNQITALQGAVGSPLVAATAAAMTDTTKIYVYTGSETGYTNGNWYYYNGSAWTSGGVYNATAINTDTTLTVAGMAADAKATGDELNNLKSSIAYNDDGYFEIDYDIIENEYPSSSGFPSYNNWWRSDYIEVDFRNGFYYKTKRLTGDNYFYDQNHTAIKKFTLKASNSYTKYTDVPLHAKYMVISNEKNNTIKVLNYLLKLGEIDSLNSDLDVFVNGINITLNLNKADDGNLYGYHRIKGNFYKGGIVTVSNTKEDDYNISVYFKDASGNSTQTAVGVPYGTSKEILVENDAVYLDLYCNSYPMKGSVQIDSVDKYQNEKLEEHFNTANIVYANSKVLSHIKDAKKLLYGDEVMPLCLLHFSDIHGSSGELRRVMQMADYLGNEIDDVICTGDIVSDKYSDSISFWDGIDGTEDVLTCIGNHDVAIPPIYNAYGEGVTMSDAYNKYISPYISNWGAVYTSGHTYYYKDYSAKHIRLIALDYLLTGTDATNQNAWLQERLAEAKSSGYTVVIIEHTPLPNSVAISCGFNMIRNPWTYEQFDSMYQSSVDSFINAGGKFACYLAGHSHGDLVGYNSNYPNQIYIAVTCATASSIDNDQRRVVGEKSRDAFNIVVVDTETETIKLIRVGADIDNYLRGRNICTIDYTNKSIISDD